MGTIRLRSDQGPAICAVAQEIAASRTPAKTIVETTPRASHSSLGSAERMCQTIGGQVRVFRIEIEERWKVAVRAKDPIMEYVIAHASWVCNRFQPTRGATPYEKVQHHTYRGLVFNFAEPVMVRVSDLGDVAKLDSRWRPGVWAGKLTDSDEHIVATMDGIVHGRSVRPLAASEVPEGLYEKVSWKVAGEKEAAAGREDIEKKAAGKEKFAEKRTEEKSIELKAVGAPKRPLAQSAAAGLARHADRGVNVRTQEFRNFLREKGATAGCAACEKPCGRYHTPACQERRREWEEARKRRAEEGQQELPMKRRLESQERPEKHERGKEDELMKDVEGEDARSRREARTWWRRT